MPRYANTVPICCVMSRRTFAVLGLGAIASFVTLQACDTRNHGDPGTYAPPTADAEGTEDEAAEPALEDAAKTAVDPARVYLSGYSGGGETVSLVMGMQPKLFRRALHVSSQWDGDKGMLVDAQVPVRLSIGEADDYYGSGPAVQAAADIRARYEAAGLSSERIEELLVLDVKPASYFTDQGFVDQHGGGAALFARDAEVMGWLFGK